MAIVCWTTYKPQVCCLTSILVLRVVLLRDGAEAVKLGSCCTVCKLHLASPGLHVDLDGDGVLDHIQASGVSAHSQTLQLLVESKTCHADPACCFAWQAILCQPKTAYRPEWLWYAGPYARVCAG